jgi:hypothetical protein
MATKKKPSTESAMDAGERLAPTDPLTADVRGTTLAPSNAVVLLRECGGAAEWPLDRTRHAFTLGSGKVDIVVPRQYVSRLHATLRRDQFWLEVRNESQNGTFFGGEPHDRAPVKPGEVFTVGTTTLLALDDFMIAATGVLRRQFGREAYAAVDAALVAIVRREQPPPPLALTGPHGTEPHRLAAAIHAASPRRELPFEVIDVLTTRLAFEAAIARVGSGSVFIDLRPLREKKVTAAMHRALFGPKPKPTARVIVGAPTLDQVHAAFDTERVRFDEIATPPLATRPREIVELLDQLMAEQASPVRASQLPLDRQAALARYPWPGNQDELRTAAIRIGAYLASAGNLSAAARVIGLHHSTLRESLERIGAIAP